MGPLNPALRPLGAAIGGSVEAVAERVMKRARAEIPEFASAPLGEYEAWVADAAGRIAAALVAGRLPGIEDSPTDNEWIDRAARAGVPITAVHAAMQIYIEEIRAEGLSLADQVGVSPSEIMELVTKGWEAWDLALAQSATRYHRALSIPESPDARRRYEFIETLIRGRKSGVEIEKAARGIGLDPRTSFAAFRLRPSDPDVAPEAREPAVTRAIARQGARGVVANRGNELAGLVPETVVLQVEDCYCGLGPAVPLARARDSFADASIALEAARRFGLPGVHSVQSLGLDAFVVATERHAAGILAKYVEPVASASKEEVLLDTVAVYLTAGMEVGDAAARLHLHRNSLRKRLRRYEELTDTNLSKIEDLVGIWWALRLRESRRGPAAPRPPSAG